jgi:putative transposase
MRLHRLDFPGARHHLMNRGARREPIFLDDDDRRAMLDLLADLPERFGVRVHGYALMPNHDHLMLEPVWGELSRAMRHVNAEFAQRLNRRYRWDGPVYKGR